MIILWALLTGVGIGICSGLVGVGGGVLLIPILVYAFHMNQHQAQGTSLAMLLPPTGLLAFMRYYKSGNADLGLGLLIAAGVFVGGYFGGEWAQGISNNVLRKVFALILVGTAIKMFFEKG